MRILKTLLSGALFGLWLATAATGQVSPNAPLAEVGGMTVASGPASNSLFLHHVPELNVLPTTVVGNGPFEFLPFEMTGRLGIQRFDPARPQRVETAGGLVRVRLPNGNSVFRYRRAANQFGWMLVDGDGVIHILVERPALPGPNPDPFYSHLAASRDGSLLAVSTYPQAGGEVFLLSGDGEPLFGAGLSLGVGGPSSLSVDAPTTTFADGALFFSAVLPATLYRVDTSVPSVATPVPLPPSGGSLPAFIEHEFAVSDDGSTLALLAGQMEKMVDVYAVTASGVATNLTQSAGEYSLPGYAPTAPHGPFLAVSPDGSKVMYIKDMAGSNELFIRNVPLPGSAQVTSNAWFDVSIDHPGSLGVAIPPSGDVVFLAAPEENFQQADVYAASLIAGTLTVQNLSATGGSTPPFPNQATLNVVDMFQIGGVPDAIVISTTPIGQDLLSVGASGFTTLLSSTGPIQDLVGSESGRIFFTATPSGGMPTVYVLEGSTGLPTLQPLLPSMMPGQSFLSLTPRPSGDELALITTFGPGMDFGLRIDVATGIARNLLITPADFSRSIAWTPLGHLAFAAGMSPAGPFYPIFDVASGFCVPMNVSPGVIRFVR